MENTKKKSQGLKFTTHDIVFIGLMAAIVFVTNYISFKIPLMAGAPTRIHIANGFCLLSGLLLGGVKGGLSAGIGSMLFDFTDPQYVPSAIFTLIFKFLLAYVAGKIAYSRGKNADDLKTNILAGILGQTTYIILYLGKKFISGLLLGNAMGTVLTTIVTSLFTSIVNAIIAVIIAMILLPAFKKAIKHNK